MNILLINHYAGSIKHGMEYRPFYLAREWVRMGHDVTIVAASHSHVRSINPTINSQISGETIEGVKYLWFKTPEYNGNGIKRAINILTFAFQIYLHQRHLTEEVLPDVVIASSTHPLDSIPARFLANKVQARLIYEVHDLWPLSLIELGGMPTWHPFVMLIQLGENFAYRYADGVVSMLPNAHEHMVEHGMMPKKFNYIPNGINVEEWRQDRGALPDQHIEVINQLAKSGLFLIGYAGAHGIANALSTVVEAGLLLQDEPIAFVLVGNGLEKQNLHRMVEEHGIRNIFFLPPVAKPSIPSLLSKMDVLYIGLKKEPLFRFGISPNKLMDYMMAAKPIIQAIEAGNNPVRESGCGLSIPSEDPIALAAAIQKMMQIPLSERLRMGQQGQDYVLQNHDYKILAQQFIEVINNLSHA